MKDKVSIIIPTYKTNDSLARAINSCINQTYKNIEIIVVDDNKPNSDYRKHAEKILNDYKKYSNIKYIKNTDNKNGSYSRNNGVKNSSGSWIAFLDDDDFYSEEKIERQINKVYECNADFCVCYYFRNNKIVTFDEKTDYSYDLLMNLKAPQTSSFFIKREKFDELNGFDESYARHQDYEFLIRACQICKMCLVNEPLYYLDTNGVNNVPNAEKLEEIKIKFLNDFDYLIEEKKYNRKKIYSRNFSLVFIAYLKNKKYTEAIRVLMGNFNCYFLFYLLYKIYCIIRFKVRGV